MKDRTVTLENIRVRGDVSIQILGVNQNLNFKYEEDKRLTVIFSEEYKESIAYAIKITSEEFRR